MKFKKMHMLLAAFFICTFQLSAIDAGDRRILITGGYQAGVALIKVEKKSDGTSGVTELYKNPDFGAHTQPPVLINGDFYARYSTNERKDGLVCMSIDGRVKYKTMTNPLFDKGGMVVANGFLPASDGRSTLSLINPDQSAFKVLSQAEILKERGSGNGNDDTASRAGGTTRNRAPIALADARLLIRDQSRLMCIKVLK